MLTLPPARAPAGCGPPFAWPPAIRAVSSMWDLLRSGWRAWTRIARRIGDVQARLLLVFLYFASVIVLLGAEVARANVLDREATRMRSAATDVEPQPGPPDDAAQPVDGPPPAARPISRWSLAIGGAVTGVALRWLRRGRGRIG